MHRVLWVSRVVPSALPSVRAETTVLAFDTSTSRPASANISAIAYRPRTPSPVISVLIIVPSLRVISTVYQGH